MVCFTEALEVDDLPLPQETNNIADIRVIRQAQNVVIGHPCFLFSGHILGQITNHIPLNTNTSSVPWRPRGSGGINPSGVIYKVGCKSALFQLLLGKPTGKLMNDSANHLQVT